MDGGDGFAIGEASAGDGTLPPPADFLGEADRDLDELKAEAVAIGPEKKKIKLTHKLLLDDPKGIKKLVEDLPKVRFRGKGREFEDVRLMLGHYEKWFQALYPTKETLEDVAFKATEVLGAPEKGDDGDISDPIERLHMMRFEYKSNGGVGTLEAHERAKKAAAAVLAAAKAKEDASKISEEARLRIDANRLKALEVQRQKAVERGDEEAVERLDKQVQAARIAANTARALAIKAKKNEEAAAMDLEAEFAEAAAQAAARPAAAAAPAPNAAAAGFDDEEDVFGFGGGLDDFDGETPGRPAAAATSAAPAARAPAPACLDEEDDPFGFGFGFDDDM